MKIGIVTFHRAHNFGAVLQCYALKKALEYRGNDVEVIDYWPSYRNGMYDLFDFRYFKLGIPVKQFVKGNLYSFIYTFLNFFGKKRRIEKFNDFIVRRIGLVSKTQNVNWKAKSASLDCYVFGSDQIWRYFSYPSKNGFDFTYWGDIGGDYPVKKITYAASMGKISDFDKLDRDSLAKLLKNFDDISVRENSLSERICNAIGYKPKVVLDPVFLLTMGNWLELFPEIFEFKKNNKYLLLYNITKSKETEDFAIAYAKKNGLSIIRITADSSPFCLGDGYVHSPGPIEFLTYIFNADFVVSSSFHGVAFSVIFNKQFVSLGIGKNSDRVKSLLSGLGIEHKYMDGREEWSAELNGIEIDYIFVSEKLEQLLDLSFNYLDANLV